MTTPSNTKRQPRIALTTGKIRRLKPVAAKQSRGSERKAPRSVTEDVDDGDVASEILEENDSKSTAKGTPMNDDDSSSSDEEERLLQSKLLRYEDADEEESDQHDDVEHASVDVEDKTNEGETHNGTSNRPPLKLLSYAKPAAAKGSASIAVPQKKKPVAVVEVANSGKTKPLPKPSKGEEEIEEDDEKDVIGGKEDDSESQDGELDQSDKDDDDSLNGDEDSSSEEENEEGTKSKDSKHVDRRESRLLKRLRNEVRRQIRTAKKFESRKIIRDIKTVKAKSQPDEKKLEKLEAKLGALKTIDARVLAAKVTASKQKEEDEEAPKSSANDTVEGRLEQKLLEYKGVQAAMKEFVERPKREQSYREFLKKKSEDLALKEAKKLERQSYTLVCGMPGCTAKFATEEARTVHRVKRHNTTGDLKTDMTMGLRTSRPGQRDRKAFALLRAGASPEEIEKVRNPKKSKKMEADGESGENKQKQRPVRFHSDNNDDATNKRPRRDERPSRDAQRMPAKQVRDQQRQEEKMRRDQQQERPSKRPQERSNPRREASAHKFEKKPHVKEETKAASAEEKLHPSWEAKRKSKQVMEFQGKAVEFSDDE